MASRRSPEEIPVSDAIYRGLVQFADDAVLVCLQQGGAIIDANPAALDMFGYSIEELRERIWFDLHPSASADVVEEMRNTLRRVSGATVPDIVMTRKNGTRFHANMRLITYATRDHELLAGIIRDISAHRDRERALERANARLATSEATYRGLVTSTDDAVIVLDFESALCVEANPAACSALGYSGAEWNRLRGRDLHPPEYGRVVVKVSAELHATGASKRNDAPILRKNGSIYYADLSLNVFTAAGRKLMVAILRDSTERRARAEELIRSNQELISARAKALHAQKLAAVGEVAAGVAHEINNPAAFVSMNLDAMMGELMGVEQVLRRFRRHMIREPDPARKRELMAILEDRPIDLRGLRAMLNDNREGVERIRTVTRDLRLFSRVEQSEVEEVDLNDVIRSTLNLLNSELRHRARIEVLLNEVPRLFAQRGKLAQVVTNLVLNAAQAIVEGAAESNTITIRTESDEDGVLFSVEDTGTGMAPEIAARIFDPFFTTKPREQGTGLGLSLCSEIVAAHRGRISVTSTPRKGSRFEVRIPTSTGLVPRPASPPPPASRATTGKRILVIDDDAALVRAYRRMLSEHDAVVVASGVHALREIDANDRFDLIVCDLMMPEMDGPQVYETIRASHPHLARRIVFCTGGAFTTRAREFVQRVDNPVLDKPVQLEAIERILGADPT